MKNKNKEIFLKYEGDNWLRRNLNIISRYEPSKDKLYIELKKIIKKISQPEILEVGCSTAERLKSLKKNFKLKKIYGIDPSKKAISIAKKNIIAKVSTADKIDEVFKKKEFDIIIFGFCLYLCEPKDYNKIFNASYKIIKKNRYLFILDFYTKYNYVVKYKHDKKVKVYKTNYCNIFKKKYFKLEKLKIFKIRNDKKNSKYAIYIFKKK